MYYNSIQFIQLLLYIILLFNTVIAEKPTITIGYYNVNQQHCSPDIINHNVPIGFSYAVSPTVDTTKFCITSTDDIQYTVSATSDSDSLQTTVDNTGKTNQLTKDSINAIELSYQCHNTGDQITGNAVTITITPDKSDTPIVFGYNKLCPPFDSSSTSTSTSSGTDNQPTQPGSSILPPSPELATPQLYVDKYKYDEPQRVSRHYDPHQHESSTHSHSSHSTSSKHHHTHDDSTIQNTSKYGQRIGLQIGTSPYLRDVVADGIVQSDWADERVGHTIVADLNNIQLYLTLNHIQWNSELISHNYSHTQSLTICTYSFQHNDIFAMKLNDTQHNIIHTTLHTTTSIPIVIPLNIELICHKSGSGMSAINIDVNGYDDLTIYLKATCIEPKFNMDINNIPIISSGEISDNVSIKNNVIKTNYIADILETQTQVLLSLADKTTTPQLPLQHYTIIDIEYDSGVIDMTLSTPNVAYIGNALNQPITINYQCRDQPIHKHHKLEHHSRHHVDSDVLDYYSTVQLTIDYGWQHKLTFGYTKLCYSSAALDSKHTNQLIDTGVIKHHLQHKLHHITLFSGGVLFCSIVCMLIFIAGLIYNISCNKHGLNVIPTWYTIQCMYNDIRYGVFTDYNTINDMNEHSHAEFNNELITHDSMQQRA